MLGSQLLITCTVSSGSRSGSSHHLAEYRAFTTECINLLRCCIRRVHLSGFDSGRAGEMQDASTHRNSWYEHRQTRTSHYHGFHLRTWRLYWVLARSDGHSDPRDWRLRGMVRKLRDTIGRVSKCSPEDYARSLPGRRCKSTTSHLSANDGRRIGRHELQFPLLSRRHYQITHADRGPGRCNWQSTLFLVGRKSAMGPAWFEGHVSRLRYHGWSFRPELRAHFFDLRILAHLFCMSQGQRHDTFMKHLLAWRMRAIDIYLRFMTYIHDQCFIISGERTSSIKVDFDFIFRHVNKVWYNTSNASPSQIET